MSRLPTLLIKGSLVPLVDDPKVRRELNEKVPVEYILDWFEARVNKTGIENRVLILKSETASGKSTAFPPELYKRMVRNRSNAGIICTQPRVATAIENVMEMLVNYSSVLRLGETIGWSTKYNKFRPKSVGLLSATIGTLAQQLRSATDLEIMKKYKYILIDETHERDLQTDMTIYMLKNLILRNQHNIDCPFVVLMSATFEPEPLLKYFGVQKLTNFIWCTGGSSVIDERWEWNENRTVSDYTRAAADVCERILRENPDDDPLRGDILIFMPGSAEIGEVVKHLRKLNETMASENKKVFSLLKIDSNAFATQNRDFMWTVRVPISDHVVTINGKKYSPSRRIIITTNVAETGLTLSNLKYVIDAGYNREIEYNPILGIRGLLTKPAPVSRIRQRKGRVGRKFDGVFYPLYPKYIFDRLPKQQYPQILIEDISPIALDIICEQLKAKSLAGNKDPEFIVSDIDLIDVPTPDAISTMLEKLYSLGFISMFSPPFDLENNGEIDNKMRFGLTKLGMLAKNFSMISPESIRMILAAYYWECSIMDMITIAAFLSIDMKSFTKTADVEEENPKPVQFNVSWTAIYKLGLPGWISSPGMVYKIRLLIADEFINGLILFNAIKHILASSETRSGLTDLKNWCDQNQLSFKGCIEFVRARDDLIEQLLGSKMELFQFEDNSIIHSREEDFMTNIAKIKHCIYDGYRNNLIIREGASYKTLSGLSVLSPKLFHEDEKRLAEKSQYGHVLTTLPQFCVFKELSLKNNRKTMKYDIVANTISTLDGFVSIDPAFMI